MTNQEAIEILSQIRDILLASNSWLPSTDNPIKESFGMAINALTAETHDKRTKTHTCDCVLRQDAIDAMANTLWHYPNECYRNLNKYEFAQGLAELGLKSVPSAQPKIIYCKDCKHHHRDNNGAYYCGRKEYGYGWGLNDFCSDAERRIG